MEAGEYLVSVDDRGRVLLPREVRERLGIRGRDRLVLRLRSDGVIEMYRLEELRAAVEEVARRKLRGWREEDHEATRLLEVLARR